MSQKETVYATGAPAAGGPYCHARWAGNLLYLSGQIGLDPETGKLVGEGVAEQVNQVMENLLAVLSSAKLGWADLVKATIYLADMNDYGSVNENYARYFEHCEYVPSRVCVQVAALPLGARVEIEGVAMR